MFYLLHERFSDDNDVDTNKFLNLGGIFRAIFWLDEIGDANTRDEVKKVLIDEPDKNRQRFLWKKYTDNALREYFIPYGLFEEVSLALIRQIEEDVEQFALDNTKD